ncbi:MFS transporter [Parafrankia colletiae]|uniref:MFS transporter n=1 Tax=Parafrankia colletiae TaxID=573497 RepID=UPI0038996885
MKCQKSSACRCTLSESLSATRRATVVLPPPGGPVITITLPVVAPEARADASGRVGRGLLMPHGLRAFGGFACLDHRMPDRPRPHIRRDQELGRTLRLQSPVQPRTRAGGPERLPGAYEGRGRWPTNAGAVAGKASEDFFIIGVANPLVEEDLGASSVETGLISAAAIAGAMFGAALLGPLADRFGRRRVLRIDLVLFVAFSALCVVAWDVWSLIAFRFVLGLAIGLGYPIAAGYLAETCRPDPAAGGWSALLRRLAAPQRTGKPSLAGAERSGGRGPAGLRNWATGLCASLTPTGTAASLFRRGFRRSSSRAVLPPLAAASPSHVRAVVPDGRRDLRGGHLHPDPARRPRACGARRDLHRGRHHLYRGDRHPGCLHGRRVRGGHPARRWTISPAPRLRGWRPASPRRSRGATSAQPTVASSCPPAPPTSQGYQPQITAGGVSAPRRATCRNQLIRGP